MKKICPSSVPWNKVSNLKPFDARFQTHGYLYTHSSSVRMFRARAEAGAGARCRARTLMHGLLMLVVLPVAAAG